MCEKYKPNNVAVPLICYDIPNRPFEKIGVDFCEWVGKSYLVIVDLYVKTD